MRRIAGILAMLVMALTPAPAALSEDAPARSLPAEVSQEVRLGGDYLLDGAVTVQKEGRLILEEGTRVRVLKDASITVHGRMEIRGTQARPVIFSAPDGITWNGISLLAGSESVIEFTRISGARTALSLIACYASIRHTAVKGCEKGLYLVREARADVSRSQFSANKVGLAVEMRSTGEFRASTFRGNEIGFGIASGGVPVVSGNRFESNAIGLQVLQRYPGKIEGNLFKGNRDGVRLYQNGPDTVLEKNLFVDNTEAAILALSYTSPTVTNNFISGGKYGVVANQFSSPRLVNNVLRGMEQALHLNKKNSSEVRGNILSHSVTGIFCDFSSYPTVRDNLFADNETHIRLGRFQSSDWEGKAGSRGLVLRSAARQGSRNPRLAEGPEQFPEAVDGSGNWWDARTLAEMEAKGADADISTLFDGHDLPEVTYEGFGEETYRLDRIIYVPPRTGPPEGAGLRGWKGTEDELSLPD
ncbi:MAG: right-handed parallel beta-helix repeat-containing protein [bacterium]|nr:MAG: right-handed parallel beta-helix repeat-containing protein [bacterium]